MGSGCNEDQNPEQIPGAGAARYIRVPARGVEDIQALLPAEHWRPGYSAYELAHSWWDADQFHNGFPPNVRAVLNTSGEPLLQHLRPLMIFPEFKTELPAKGNCSQTDLWILATPPFIPFTHSDDDFAEDNADWTKIDPSIGFAQVGPRELVSIAVEGKVLESFGPVMADWLKNASSGKLLRLRFLCHRLGIDADIFLNPAVQLDPKTFPGSIRYQLIHRTAAALIEAERFCAKHAVMLVHSFDPSDSGFSDYEAFVALLRGTAAINQVVTIGERSGIRLHLAWVRDKPKSVQPSLLS